MAWARCSSCGPSILAWIAAIDGVMAGGLGGRSGVEPVILSEVRCVGTSTRSGALHPHATDSYE